MQCKLALCKTDYIVHLDFRILFRVHSSKFGKCPLLYNSIQCMQYKLKINNQNKAGIAGCPTYLSDIFYN